MGEAGRQRALLAVVGALALGGLGCTERVPLISSATITDVDAAVEPEDAYRPPDRPAPADAAPADTGVDAGRDVRCTDYTQTHRLNLEFPEVVVALDRSFSMFNHKPGAKSFWTAAREALLDYMRETDGAIAFGYAEFPGRVSCDPGFGCCTRFPVSPSLNSHGGIEQAWSCNTQGCFDTADESPSGHALSRIRTQYFDTETDPMPDRYVLLVTDGEPSCGSDTGECAYAEHQATRLYSNGGVNTIVLPLGDDAKKGPCLDAVAVAGHTREPGATAFPAAADPGQVGAELRKAMAQVEERTCRFLVKDDIRNRDSLEVTVEFKPLPRDPAHKEGWDFDPSGSPEIQIYGTACKKLRCSLLFQRDFRAEEACTQCGSTITCP
ncbi:MAG TPA: hypothetical protein VN914_19610 [Polyangia bacterium]|nr:hypothetical protein [Polyangia bacterium]